MNKTSKYIAGIFAASLMAISMASCGGSGSSTPSGSFSFTIALESGNEGVLYIGKQDKIVIHETNPSGQATNYEFTVFGENPSHITVDKDGYITPVTATEEGETVGIRVTEKNSKKKAALSFTVTELLSKAKGGFSWASNKKERLKILGELEEYAMKNFLTGITLFESAGFVRYSGSELPESYTGEARKVHLPVKEYITGYGFGLLGEGSITGTLSGATDNYPTYYHTATSSDPHTINAWDATGSQVSDLNSYITSSYWGTKLDAAATGYEWYPVLAADKRPDGSVNDRPVHVGDDYELDMYTTWKIYVKTGDTDNILYRTSADSDRIQFNNRKVALEDYEFVYQLLLTEQSILTRGAELASDTTYGIKGANVFFRRTKDVTDPATVTKTWNEMKASGELGIQTGYDEDEKGGKHPYIQLELVNPIDAFTAMYTLSSNLYSPMPREFIESLSSSGDDYIAGVKNYGVRLNASEEYIDTTLSVGPYFLDQWEKDASTTFTRNDSWFECKAAGGNRYNIDGIYMRVNTAAVSQSDAIYNMFENDKSLDVTSIPTSRIKEKTPYDKPTKGDSTFKLNVNSCTQDRWNELFGDNGTLPSDKRSGDNAYLVKPWMSNKNFLNGLFWSIDRETFANERGYTPSINYFANSYMSDPELGQSYNETKEHQKAISSFHTVDQEGNDNYGYSESTAIAYFNLAVSELAASGAIKLGKDSDHPYPISIDIMWMYQTDIREYGEAIKSYFERTFNDKAVCGGLVKLTVNNKAVTDWQLVYTEHLQIGKFDLGFGAISGNSYNPLNFLEVLKSDDSSGFTLNWGADTSKIDTADSTGYIEHDGKAWSFDALWAAADHGTVVKDGLNVNPVNHGYIESVTNGDGVRTNNVYDGATIKVPFEFVDLTDGKGNKIDDTKLDISKIRLYLLNANSVTLDKNKGEFEIEYSDAAKTQPKNIVIHVSAALGKKINDELVTGNKLDEKAEKQREAHESEEEIDKTLHPFRYDFYDFYWSIEVQYIIDIGFPSEGTYFIAINKATDDETRKAQRATL